VNEAMMCGCVIIATRHGFLPDILSDELCYFMPDCSGNSVALCIEEIAADRERARDKALLAREFFKANFVSSVVFSRLCDAYRELTK
jgi:glycosyltransferase involved in cell wall biosynthesis